ncbi:hypothetical protein [Ruegeria sp. HKCCD7318]|uniref:hypothetical protein n=1 Tax=Ruegeria sp. HKCCD7318 TaxID=2683014 RepID=UPI0014928351|nr:hypothetical protein [Ruegeria sp. HKCCD7318]NOE32502.1 hypothetical protein [Ruegeria sp. HKCCD7318]
MTEKVTRGEYTGLSDRYSGGVLVHDYSKQTTPKVSVVPRPNKHAVRAAKAARTKAQGAAENGKLS